VVRASLSAFNEGRAVGVIRRDRRRVMPDVSRLKDENHVLGNICSMVSDALETQSRSRALS